MLVLVLLGGLIFATLQFTAREREVRVQERVAAEARWEQAAYNQYEMEVSMDGCRYQIRYRSVSATIRSVPLSCSFPPTTVARLFTIAEHDGLVEELCDARGCPCESVTSVHGQYDPALGYPTNVVVEVDLHPTWWKYDLWQHIVENRALPPCLTHHTSVIKVLQLTGNS
jgi:hypothetical protein